MKILIIIVFFKNSSDLKNLLDDLKKINAEICVVNNGERKDVNFVKRYKNVEVIQNEKNLGFAKGVNRALTKYKIPAFAGMTERGAGMTGGAEYEWLWILNPDCRVEIEGKNHKDLDSRLRGNDKERGGNEEIEFDIFSPVVYDENGKVWFSGGKINRWTGEVTQVDKIRNLKFEIRNEKDKIINLKKRTRVCKETIWVSGCTMFIKPKVFEKIGFFDERFFLFYEDVDFCLRAKKEGFKIGIGGLGGVGGLGRIKIIHQVSMSVNQLKGKEKYRIEMKSKWLFLRKHWREFYLSAFVVSWMREIKHKMTN